ncbi:MAG: crossover junction endodeoxyribonuclease RuvC [Gemmatimonadetes bacterium]|nr:crossover junction endodeoxyribonuclease RuvC [Gemmatimonadota bacterium]
MTVRVLGIDPGTAVTGYGIIEPSNGHPGRLVECGIIRTDPNEALWHRLDAIHEGVVELIAKHRPTALALEGVFYAKNVHTTVVLGHARGVIMLAAAQAGIDVSEFPPATVKKAIAGTTGAGKSQVGYMVQRLLNLKAPPQPHDAADGVAIALTCLMAGQS